MMGWSFIPMQDDATQVACILTISSYNLIHVLLDMSVCQCSPSKCSNFYKNIKFF